jgi:DNA-binding transcriptional regulator GbsR (MarR family)
MRRLTVTIPDDFYESFISFFKHIPSVFIKENNENNENILDEIPPWQQEIVLERMKNAKPEDYIDADEDLNL